MQSPVAFAAVVAAGCLGLAVANPGLHAAAPPPAAAASAGCACVPKPVLPVVLDPMPDGRGWRLNFRLPPLAAVSELFVRFDDHDEEATGHEQVLDVMTGKPEVLTWTVVPNEWVTPREHTVTVRIAHPDGTVEGPYALHFDPRGALLTEARSRVERTGDEMLLFAEHSDEVCWLFLSSLFELRDSLSEIRYSIDDCSLRERIAFPRVDMNPAPVSPHSAAELTSERAYLTLPRTTRSACAQVVFRDGTVSRVMRISRTPDAAPEVQDPHPPG
jgi:hypothetical protein